MTPTGTGGGGQAGTSSLRGACPAETRVGGFSVEAQVDFGVIQGTVLEGVIPTAIPRLVAEIDGCRLIERRSLVCTPACVSSMTCGEQGTCIPYPRGVNVGTVTITGLTRATVMQARMPDNAYYVLDADNPPFSSGARIALDATGADGHPGFQLAGVGSDPLGSDKPTWILDRGKDLKVEWRAGGAGLGTKVVVELSVDQHGISPLSLSCEFPDTGSATIAGATINRVLDSGTSGFPNGRIFRRTADRVTTDRGCVDLVVGSPIAAAVSVVGFTPCQKTADCPTGKTCNLALERCE